MKNLLKGALAIGATLVAGYVVFKKIKKDIKEENNEKVIDVEPEQQLTQEQQELYELTVETVRKQMKPYMRRMKIYRIARCVLMLVLANCLSIVAITYDMERMDNTAKAGA